MAARRSDFRLYASVLTAPVSDETLELSDSHRFSLDSEDTASLALSLLRAYSSADRWERGVLCDYCGSVCKVAGSNSRDELRNLHVDRTGTHAAWILAVETSCGFELSLFHIIAVADFFKVSCTDLRILFSDRYSWNLVCHYFPLPILHL